MTDLPVFTPPIPHADMDPAITGYQVADPSDVNHPVYLPINGAGALFVDAAWRPYYWDADGHLVSTPTLPSVTIGKTVSAPWEAAVVAPVVVPEAPAPVAAPAVEGADAPSAPPPTPAPVVEVPHTATVTITPHSSGGVLVRIETATGEVITKVVKMAEHLVAEVATFAHQHFGQH